MPEPVLSRMIGHSVPLQERMFADHSPHLVAALSPPSMTSSGAVTDFAASETMCGAA
jgi:hypothetical protein